MGIYRRYRHIRRYRRIAEVFIRHGLGYLVEQLDLTQFLPLRRRWQRLEKVPGGRGYRIRRVLEELGPTFIKFGQTLSTRAELLPSDIIRELTVLQDRVVPVPFDSIRQVLTRELGQPLEKCFAELDETPLASASIAQVHGGRLPDGRPVIVKVKKPGIAQTIEVDLEILHDLAGIVDERLGDPTFSAVELVDEFQRSLRREMDFVREGRNAERFRRVFADSADVYIPEVFWDCSTESVLTLERVEGIKITNVAQLEERGIDRREVATRCARVFMRQVLLEGFFHGDPHPGNILVGDDGRLILLDFGIVGRLSDKAMMDMANLFVGVTRMDSSAILRGLGSLGRVPYDVDEQLLRADTEDLVQRYYGLPLGQIEFGRVIRESVDVSRRHRIRFAADFSLLVKVVIAVEGIVQELDPTLNILTVAEPFARRLLAQRYDPRRLVAAGFDTSQQYLSLLGRLPRQLHTVLSQAENGELEIRFKHMGLDRLITRLDIASNRLAFSIITAALVVGSSMIVQTNKGPLLMGLPLFGLLGYLAAAVIGIGLLVSIIRSGRL